MALLRKYIWVLVILGMVFVSVVIGLVFVIVNKCISRKAGRLRLQPRPDTKIESNKYQVRQPGESTPPLPPRTQFLTAAAQSYENLAEDDKCDEQSDHDYEETLDLKAGGATPQLNPPCNHSNTHSGVPVAQSYENPAEENDYEESVDPLPDYLKVEDETESYLPPPPPPTLCESNMRCDGSLAQSYENLADENDYEESVDQPDYVKVEDEEDAARDNYSTASTDDYDDIGEDEEDYDDVA